MQPELSIGFRLHQLRLLDAVGRHVHVRNWLSELVWRDFNSGSIGWVRGRMGEVAYLGTWGPDPGQDRPTSLGGDGQLGTPNTGWPRYNRIAMQPADYVGPGQVAWFQFTIVAPASRGTYKLYLRPLIEGAAWLEDYGVFWVVTVC